MRSRRRRPRRAVVHLPAHIDDFLCFWFVIRRCDGKPASIFATRMPDSRHAAAACAALSIAGGECLFDDLRSLGPGMLRWRAGFDRAMPSFRPVDVGGDWGVGGWRHAAELPRR